MSSSLLRKGLQIWSWFQSKASYLRKEQLSPKRTLRVEKDLDLTVP